WGALSLRLSHLLQKRSWTRWLELINTVRRSMQNAPGSGRAMKISRVPNPVIGQTSARPRLWADRKLPRGRPFLVLAARASPHRAAGRLISFSLFFGAFKQRTQ